MVIGDILKNLGFDEKEAKAYLALLELGTATPLKISQKSDIKRPTTYLVLQALEEKGMVSRVVRGKKTLFAPQHPQKLVAEAELRLKNLQEVVPQLESLFRKEEAGPRIMIYEGIKEIDHAIDEWFAVGGEAVFISTLKLSIAVFPETFRKLELTSLSENFRVREIIDDTEESRKYYEKVSGEFRKVRFLSQKLMPFEVYVAMFGDKVMITSVKKDYFAVAIESEEISRAFRKIYEVLWENSVE